MTTRSTNQPRSLASRRGRTAYLATGMAIFGFGVAHVTAEPDNDNERTNRVVTSRTAGSVAGGSGQAVTADSRAARAVTRIQDRQTDAVTRLVQLREDRTASVVVREPLDLTGGGLKPIAGGTERVLVDGQISGSGGGGSGGSGSGGSTGGGGSGGGDTGSGGGDTGGGDPGSGGTGGDTGSGGSGSGGSSDPGSSGETFVRLVPGSGFTSFMPNSSPVGHPEVPGYDAKAIARWDVVPYQVIDGEFHIGVVAFHMNDIDHVLFSAEGGPWKRVDEMQLNPRTNVWEYTAVLDAADFQDGPIEIRAVVYPKVGVPRVLAGSDLTVSNGEHSMFLYADPTGRFAERIAWVDPVNGDDTNSGSSSSNARRTLWGGVASIQDRFGSIDGGVVYMMEGVHEWRSRVGPSLDTEHAMLTFAGAPGTSPESVVLGRDLDVTGNIPRVNRVKVTGVTLAQSAGDTTHSDSLSQLWIDNCRIVGGGRAEASALPNSNQWQNGLYVTGTSVRNARNGMKTGSIRIVRDVHVRELGEDAFFNVLLLINSSADDLQKGHSSYHNDVVQYTGDRENTIVYGLNAVRMQAQTIFSRGEERHDNAAFVNVLVEGGYNGTGLRGQWIRSSDHVLFWNVAHLGTQMWFRSSDPAGGDRHVTNLSIRNSVFERVSYPSTGYPDPYIAFSNNHFISGSPFGEYATTGDPGFVDQFNRQFVPAANSPLRYRIDDALVPIDALNKKLRLPAAIGAVQPD